MSQVTYQRRLLLGVLGTSVTLAVLGGCGPRRPETVAVTGVVTYQGAPVEGAEVMFLAKDGRPANGKTDATAVFTLQTFDSPDGAILGEHTVVISRQIPVPKHQLSPDFQPGGRFSRYPQMRESLPERYASPLQSPLKVTVSAGEDNHFTFDLTE